MLAKPGREEIHRINLVVTVFAINEVIEEDAPLRIFQGTKLVHPKQFAYSLVGAFRIHSATTAIRILPTTVVGEIPCI